MENRKLKITANGVLGDEKHIAFGVPEVRAGFVYIIYKSYK